MPDSLAAQRLTPLQRPAQLQAMVRRDLLGPAGWPRAAGLTPLTLSCKLIVVQLAYRRLSWNS